MIELLSRLNPRTSSFIAEHLEQGTPPTDPDAEKDAEEMAKAAKAMRCPTCRGKKRVKRPAVAGTPAWFAPCPRCHGSGRSVGGLGGATKRGAGTSVLTPEQIGFACAGMPDHWYRAAVVHVTHDLAVRRALVEDIAERIVTPMTPEWRLPEGVRPIRVLGLSRVTAANVMLRDGEVLMTDQGAELMCCRLKDWEQTWRRKASAAADTARGWVFSADEYMIRRSRDHAA